MTGETIRDAAKRWVQGFDAIQQGMIGRLMQAYPEDWREVTVPVPGDKVFVYDPPEGIEENEGEIRSYDAEADLYCIRFPDGKLISADTDDFEVIRDETLPMWGTMWSFRDSADTEWMEDDGIQALSECGFRVYESDEFGYFFGIDGAGYDFYEDHWIPLYKARGLRWHDMGAKKEMS